MLQGDLNEVPERINQFSRSEVLSEYVSPEGMRLWDEKLLSVEAHTYVGYALVDGKQKTSILWYIALVEVIRGHLQNQPKGRSDETRARRMDRMFRFQTKINAKGVSL